MVTGVTVMPEFLENEGVEAVLNKLAAAGVTAVNTSPYVAEPADEKTGSREPPIDAGAGSVRLLDRPLWGKRELFLRTAPAFIPDTRLYQGLRYQPPPPSELTRKKGGLIQEFIRGAQARHLKVYLQVQAAIPPGYRVQFGGPVAEDRPRLPDGRVPPRRLANNGSLASPHIVAYAEALTRDVCRAYPDVDGIRYDWPEYPPYFLDDVFLDFGAPAEAAAGRLGYSFETMRAAALKLYRTLHGGLTNAMLERWLEPGGGRYGLIRALAREPALAEWLRFKASLVEEWFARVRKVMTAAGGARMELGAGVFPPPFSLVSGMDYARVAPYCSGLSVKLYTMHWPVIFRFYGDVLKAANPRVSEDLLVRALASWLEITDGVTSTRLEDYVYPEPNQAHPAGERAQARKIRSAQAEAGSTPVYAFVHGYGPVEDFRRRLGIGRAASAHGVWINRYGYLSEAKIAILGKSSSANKEGA